ncbi:2-hydroxymuconic semialdehyde dehydrogenase [Ferrimonas balearica]|uniref:2-hydroxymuconic semialdehyde dehydrogenase n=1 Tax=Ferrimonas balearica TaxID=44012 RepID=UPI001C99AC4E|nr:2-hydroxymuconic semialdehyde dehydrogenase [Ferrimonas balearica]MBY5990888.1 2-hydroxymuconic semialdehyde dehydrogenase [Ferrimonas balearica]
MNRRYLAYIDGQFRESDQWFDDLSPVNGELVARVARASQDQVDEAVGAARRALSGPWGSLSPAQRAALLHKLADRMAEREAEFVAAEIADTGKSMPQVRTIDIPRGTANFRFFADLIKNVPSEAWHTTTPTGQKALHYTVDKPLGVVAVIAPWNLPLLLATWKIAPALICGNTVVVKPSEETPGSMALLAECIDEVGFPPGVFNLVHGFGPDCVGQWLTEHPGVDAVTFTGESKTGGAIMKAVADGVKPVSFELGGKNAAVVFEDADLDKAIAGVARAAFTNCGQVCLCTERVYVHRSLYERFVAGLAEAAKGYVVGRPEDTDTVMGPLISRQHRDKVLGYLERARADGATFVTGGEVPQFGDDRDQGAFVLPTVITGLADDHPVNREEIFGPLCHVAPFDDEAEVIARANDSDYGLAAAIWTESLTRAHRVAPRIEAGLVWVNTWYLRDLNTPFGGVKLSGIGREGGLHSLGFYREPSTVCIALD